MLTLTERRRHSMASKPVKPRKRPYGQGSVSVQLGAYVATYTDLKTGGRRRRSFATDAEAQVFLNNWYARKQAKALEERNRARARRPNPALETLPPEPGSFSQLITSWKAAKTGTVRSSTWRNYDPALNSLAHYLGQESVDVLTEDDFLAYRQARVAGFDYVTAMQLSKENPGLSRKRLAELCALRPLSPRTVNQHLDRANDIFKWALRRNPPLVTHNPVANLSERGQRLKVEEFEPVVIDSQMIEHLISCAPQEARLEFYLLGHLALRWSEALGLGVGHIQGNMVLVRQQVTENRSVKPYRLELAAPKSKNGRRDLVASEALLAAAEESYARLASPNPHKLLRPTRTGSPFREGNWLRNIWRPTLRRAGLESSGLTPHSLRHSRLSIMASSGQVQPVDLAAFAGHDDISFTLRVYGHHFKKSGVLPEHYLAQAS
jgi:integrase